MKLKAGLSLAIIAAVGAMGAGVAGASAQPTQYFTVVSTSATGATPATIVANGPIAATGTDAKLGIHRDNFVFPDGTVSVRHEPLTQTQKFDSRTCTFVFTETGTYDLYHGTGAYAHVTGYGHYKAVGIGTGCDQSAPPTSFIQTITARGPITL